MNRETEKLESRDGKSAVASTPIRAHSRKTPPLAPTCLPLCEDESPSPTVKLGPNGTKWDLIRPNPAIKNKKILAPLRFLCLLLLESHPPFRHPSPVLHLPPNCTQLHPIAPICTKHPRGVCPASVDSGPLVAPSPSAKADRLRTTPASKNHQKPETEFAHARSNHVTPNPFNSFNPLNLFNPFHPFNRLTDHNFPSTLPGEIPNLDLDSEP